MNILIPLAGTTAFDDEQILPLVEVLNKTVIEYVISNLAFGGEDRFIFVVQQQDIDRHHLDAILRLLEPDCEIVVAPGETQGQLCSCLLAIEHLDNDEPLLIVNGNQFVFENLDRLVSEFRSRDVGGGIITFPNIHPRWSYVRVAEDGETVLEASEKRPISKHACVGIFYYRQGQSFVSAAQDVIRKGAMVGGQYFVSSTFNELILRGERVVMQEVPGESFRSLHTETGVRAFVSTMQEKGA